MTTPPSFINDGYASYESIVDSWGYDVLEFATTGAYQGDHVVLLRDGGRYGYVVIGYGSCSGCDALEAALPGYGSTDYTDVISLAEGLREDIVWADNPGDLRELLAAQLAKPDGNGWYWHDTEVSDTLRRFVVQLDGYAVAGEQ
jgi:hypothetical protein